MNRIEQIQQLLLQTPTDNFLRHALALEYIKLGKLPEAQQLFEAILTASPNYIGSYYHLAKLLANQNKTVEAIAWYQKGMEAAKAAKDQHAYNELQSAYEDLVY
jgi:tetratricopeptide (TPR) repeat protein